MVPSRWIAVGALLLCGLPAGAPAAVLPRKAPDFSINLPNGQTLPISKYRGHPVVVAFILTYCSHCQATVGVLSKLQKEYGPKGVQVLASAIEPNAQAAVPLFIKNYNPPFPVGFNNGAEAGDFIHPTGKLPQMPLLAFLDRQGNIRAQHEGEEVPFFNNLEANLRKEIQALLKVPGTPKKT